MLARCPVERSYLEGGGVTAVGQNGITRQGDAQGEHRNLGTIIALCSVKGLATQELLIDATAASLVVYIRLQINATS